MIPTDHPRYKSLVTRERLAECTRNGIVALEGLTSHGRGEAFDYLLGEKTNDSALRAEKTAAALILAAKKPVISVNGNTAALAGKEIAELQKATGAIVEVNLFHRTEERIEKITRLLEECGCDVFSGPAEPLLPLTHDRAWVRREGMYSADLILVPLEDGDRCEVLVEMGKKVIAVDLNPLSRTSRTASLTVVDEVTRALPNIAAFSKTLTAAERDELIRSLDNRKFLQESMDVMAARLRHALD